MKSRNPHDYKQNIQSVSYVFTFGKHKGETVQAVIANNPGYILWLHDEKIAKISEDVLKYAEEAEDAQTLDDAMDTSGYGFPTIWDLIGDDD